MKVEVRKRGYESFSINSQVLVKLTSNIDTGTSKPVIASLFVILAKASSNT